MIRGFWVKPFLQPPFSKIWTWIRSKKIPSCEVLVTQNVSDKECSFDSVPPDATSNEEEGIENNSNPAMTMQPRNSKKVIRCRRVNDIAAMRSLHKIEFDRRFVEFGISVVASRRDGVYAGFPGTLSLANFRCRFAAVAARRPRALLGKANICVNISCRIEVVC